jgi:DNA-binding response OmpR family regulator
MMETAFVLVVARSQSLVRHLEGGFEAEQVRAGWVRSVAQALAVDEHPDLLLFDLPPGGGERSLARLKQHFPAPILLVLQPGEPVPDLGDGHLQRPFSAEQLCQLVQDTLSACAPVIVRAPGMCLDKQARRLQIGAAFHQLTPLGCEIVAQLMGSAGQVITREELFRRVWNTNHRDSTRALDVHIAHLRRRLEADPKHPRLIVTERGIGYRIEPPLRSD